MRSKAQRSELRGSCAPTIAVATAIVVTPANIPTMCKWVSAKQQMWQTSLRKLRKAQPTWASAGASAVPPLQRCHLPRGRFLRRCRRRRRRCRCRCRCPAWSEANVRSCVSQSGRRARLLDLPGGVLVAHACRGPAPETGRGTVARVREITVAATVAIGDPAPGTAAVAAGGDEGGWFCSCESDNPWENLICFSARFR